MKISTNLKDVIESLSDLLTIGESNTIPDYYTDLLLKQDIKFDLVVNKNNYVLLKSLYFFDNKSFMYTLKLSNEEPEEKTKPSQLNIRLIPLRIKPVNASDFIHLHVIMLLEIIYRYNKDLLTDEQTEILRNYFIEHNPEVIDLDEKRTFIESIENIRTIFPHNYLSPTDKVSNSVYGLNINAPQLFFNESADIDVTRKGVKGNSEVIVRAALELSKDSNIKGIEKLNLFDHRVHGAIGSWYYAGTTHITPQMIHHVITGDKNSRITDVQYQNIVDSVNLMREVRVTIDATAENEKYYPNSDTQSRFNGNIIDAIEFENIPLNGQLSSGFIIRGEPILFIYARQKKQLYDIPLNYLKSSVDKTKETIVLHDYILHRIEVMKNPNNNMSNVIVYNSIYHIMGEQNDIPFTKQKRERIRKNTQKILDDLINKGAMKKYIVRKENKTIHSIEVIY